MKNLRSRIITRHATPAEWAESKAIILPGEQIIYDPGFDPVDQKTYTESRIKVGDGEHVAKDLSFINSKVDLTVKKGTMYAVTEVTMPTLTPAEYIPPSLSQSVDHNTLTIEFDAGSYTPATLNDGSVATSDMGVVTDIIVN